MGANLSTRPPDHWPRQQLYPGSPLILPVAIEVGGNEGAGAGANAEGEDKSGKTNRLMIAGAIVFGVGVVLEAVASSKD